LSEHVVAGVSFDVIPYIEALDRSCRRGMMSGMIEALMT